MATRYSIDTIFRAVDRMTGPVKRMQRGIGKFTASAERGFRRLGRRVDKFNKGLKKGAMIAVASFALVGAAAANVLGAGADFEQAITNVGAVSMQTRAQIAPLEKQALDLGRSTMFTATQAANAMEVLARAGFSANEILDTTPAVLSAAAASGLEIAEVANHVSNALKGMGLEMSQASMVSDVLALASSKTNSSIGSLGESISNVASTARQLRIPFNEVVAGVALLQDVGLDASVAGSAFNTMLTKMAAPSSSVAKQMRRFGISFKDAKGDMLPFAEVLEQLSIASSKAGGNFDKVAFLAELVGLRGQKAASNLADLFESGKFSQLANELENAAGSADKMAGIRMNTVKGSMLLLGSAIDAVKVKIFGLNNGALKDTIDRMTAWVSKNEELIATNVGGFISEILDNLPAIVAWMKRIGTGLAVWFTLVTILKTFILVMTAVNIVMMLNPIGLIVLAVVALVAAFTALVVWIDEIHAGFEKMPLAVKILLGPIGLLIKAIKFIKDNWDVVSNAASSLFGGDDGADGSAGANGSGSSGRSIVTPQERVARSVEESRTTNFAEVLIRDTTGKAEMTKGGGRKGPIMLQHSGAF